MRRFVARLLSNASQVVAQRRRSAARRELRRLWCEPLEARRQLASITLTLGADGLLSLLDSGESGEVANDAVSLTDDGNTLTINLGSGNAFDPDSTDFGVSGGQVVYSTDKTVATVAKASIQSISIVLDQTLAEGGQDSVIWSIVGDSSITSMSLPATAITTNVLNFTNNLVLEGDLTIVADALSVDGSIQGPFNLSVARATATFAGSLGTVADPLGDGSGVSLTLLGAGGAFAFESDVYLASGASAAADTDVTFVSNFDNAAGDVTLGGNVSLTGDRFSSAGAVMIGTVGAVPLKELRVTSEHGTILGSLDGSVTIHSAIFLESDLELRAAVDGIEVNAPVNGQDPGAQSLLLSSPGTTTLNDRIGADVPLRSVFTDATGNTVLASSIAVLTGNATFNDPVTLAGDVSIRGGGASQIEFNETLDGTASSADSLTLECPNGSFFQAAVGASAPVGDETGAAITILDGVAVFESTVATESGIVQRDAAELVTFRDTVNLGAGDTASDFQGSVLLAGITFSSAGNVTFGNASSDSLAIQDAATNIAMDVSTSGVTFIVNARTTLAADLTIQAGVGDIVINGTVDGKTYNSHNLTLNSAGETSINAEIGTDVALRSVTTDDGGSGFTRLAAHVSVGEGGATFDDPVQLAGDIHLVVIDGAANFAQSVTGGDSLVLDVDGPTNFSANVGGTGRSAAIGDGIGEAIVILSAGMTTFDGDVVTNSGILQAFTAGLVVFGANVTIGEGDPATGVGSIFEGDVELQGSELIADRDVRFGTMSGGSTLALTNGAVAIRTVANDGSVVFAAIVDGDQALTIAAHGGGDVEFRQTVGNASPPLSLTIEGADKVAFLADATIDGAVDALAAGDIVIGRTLRSLTDAVHLETTSGGTIIFESLEAATQVDLRADNAVQLSLPDRIPADITAPQLRITANNGIGSAVPLKTFTSVLAASNSASGDIRVLNSIPGALAIDEIDGQPGISNTASGGAVVIRSDTLVDVRQPISAEGAVNLTTLDSADNNSIFITAAVASNASSVTISSGDNIIALASHSITAAGKITFAGDTASVDGSTILIAATVITTATAPESISVVTGGGMDAVMISGQLQTNATSADAIAISTGNGDDQLLIDSTLSTAKDGGTVAGLLSRLTYRAGTGNDSLQLDNSGRTTAQTVTITPLANLAGLFAGSIGAGSSDSYFAAGVNVAYDNLENVTLSTGVGDDMIDATSFFNSATARRTNFVFAETPSATDNDKLTLNYTFFPEGFSPYVLATTSQGRALAGKDGSGRQFGSLRWDDVESIQATVPRIVGAVPGNALFLAGRTLFNDIASYTGTTDLVTLNVNGINFESHAGVQSLIAYGRSGNDRITVDNPAINIPVEFRGEQGADYLAGAAAADLVFGDLETDTTGGKDTIFGQGGNDTLCGFAADDLIHGNFGDDRIDGGNGNDVLYGNEGQDIVRGGAGNDILYGVSGNDVLLGEAGNDKLYAGTHRSLLIGGLGSDYLYGQVGDILVGGHVANASNNASLLDAINIWVAGVSPGPLTPANRDLIRAKLGAVTDTERDYLTGSTTTSVLDWFFASSTDVFTRRATTDLLN